MNEILFLPEAYLVALAITGIVVGSIFPSRERHIKIALLLFTLYMLPQIIFRFTTEDTFPLRAVGQYVYYLIFSFIALVTQYVRERTSL